MYTVISLCALVIVVTEGVYGNKCRDCVKVSLCPEANELLAHKITVETRKLFRSADCGFDTSGAMPKPKVCCSMLSTTHKTTKIVETPEDIRIANHKNLNLLPQECGDVKIDRIFGGDIAGLYEFPWMALIAHKTRYGNDFRCGASIINKRYVLTAAHCVKNHNVSGVRVGELDIDTEIDCQNGVCEKHIQDLTVEKSVIHKDYDPTRNGIHDIALLRLSEDIDFNHRNVHRICLPTTSQLRHKDLSNEMATVTGWGMTENHTDSAVLRKVDIPIGTPKSCSIVLNRFSGYSSSVEDAATKLCAGVVTKDSCTGDSGGPLMIKKMNENKIYRYVQYGVVSHGLDRCGSNDPGIYMDVRKYMGWILDNIYP